MFSNMKLQARIMFVFAPILIVGVLITSGTLLMLNHIDRLAERIIIADEGNRYALAADVSLQRMLNTNFDYYLLEGQGSIVLHEAFEGHITDFIKQNRVITELPSELESETIDVDSFVVANDTYQEAWLNLIDAVEAGDDEQALIELDRIFQESVVMTDIILTSAEEYSSELSDVNAAASSWFFALFFINGITLLLFISLSLATGFMLNRQIVRPLVRIRRAVAQATADTLDTESLADLNERADEVGFLSRTLVRMYTHVNTIESEYEAEIADLRDKINNLQAAEERYTTGTM